MLMLHSGICKTRMRRGHYKKKFELPFRFCKQQIVKAESRMFCCLFMITSFTQADVAGPRICPAIGDVAEDRQREVTQFLRRGIIPQQRQQKEEENKQIG